MKKKPAAHPDAPILKRPAAAMYPKADRPDISFDPTEYAGGKIYYTAKKSKYGTFRCYKRSTDRVEKAISLKGLSKKAKQSAWDEACEAIETDPRPRH